MYDYEDLEYFEKVDTDVLIKELKKRGIECIDQLELSQHELDIIAGTHETVPFAYYWRDIDINSRTISEGFTKKYPYKSETTEIIPLQKILYNDGLTEEDDKEFNRRWDVDKF